jgi:hypothetical protein
MPTQTATRPITKPDGVEEIELRMRPGLRVDIEALAAHMGFPPWGMLDVAMQEGLKSYASHEARHGGAAPRVSDAELAAVFRRQSPPDHSESVVIWMRTARIEPLAAIAASMKASLGFAIGIVWSQYVGLLGPEEHTAIRLARERARSEAGRRLDEPSIDARQQMLTEALAAIAELAVRYPAETFPVDERVGAQLDAVSEWIQTLNRARAGAQTRPPAAGRAGRYAR